MADAILFEQKQGPSVSVARKVVPVANSILGFDAAKQLGVYNRRGTFVANGASLVVITNATTVITSVVVISLNTIGGTVGVQPHVATITPGTGFTVTCTAGDTSIYNYLLL